MKELKSPVSDAKLDRSMIVDNGKACLRLEVKDKIAHAVMDRPPMNLYNVNLLSEARDVGAKVLELIAEDEVRVLVVSSAVEKAFSAGFDLDEMAENPDDNVEMNNLGRSVMEAYRNLPVPVLVAVHGFVMGSGLGPMISGDYTICADDTIFSLPESNLGLMLDWGLTYELGQRYDTGLIKRLLYTSEKFGPRMALRVGMVNEVVPAAEVETRVMEMAYTIAKNAPLAVRSHKVLIDASVRGMDIKEHHELENKLGRDIFLSHDMLEGFAAYAEHREPNFENR